MEETNGLKKSVLTNQGSPLFVLTQPPIVLLVFSNGIRTLGEKIKAGSSPGPTGICGIVNDENMCPAKSKMSIGG